MHRYFLIRLFAIIVFCWAQASAVWAGQLMTDELRAWAKDVISRETQLQEKSAPNSVAVLYFRNLTQNADLDPVRKGMAFMLVTDLSKIEKLQLVERIRLQALAEELGLSQAGLIEPSSELRIGRLLGAHFIIAGEFQKGGDVDLAADAVALSVPKQSITGRAQSRGNLADLIRIEKELLFDIVKVLKIELSQAEITALKKPITQNVYALLLFFKGIDSSDRGAFPAAADFYRQALKADPGLFPAAEALSELERSGLLQEDRSVQKILQSIKKRTSISETISSDPVDKREIPQNGGKSTVIVEW